MRKFIISVNGQQFDVEVEEVKNGSRPRPAVSQAGTSVSETAKKSVTSGPSPAAATNGSSVKVNAPMPGNILKINVNKGDAIKHGQSLLVLEAMKMENEITAPANGKVADIKVSQGECVTAGQILVEII
jgi:glutaconyl-CoA/methylmalonyl-CoA decarboxylase subunit gamma